MDGWRGGGASPTRCEARGRGERHGGEFAEWIVAAVGIMKSGAIFSGLNQRCVAAEFSYMIERCGSRLVFADARRREVLSKVEPRGRLEILPLEDLGSYRGGEAWTPPKMSPEDPLVLVFTSGSTGRPKAVLHTHVSSLASAIERQMMEPVINRDMRHLVVLPLYGNAGSVSGCLNSLVRGATFVVQRRFDAGRTWRRSNDIGLVHSTACPCSTSKWLLIPTSRRLGSTR